MIRFITGLTVVLITTLTINAHAVRPNRPQMKNRPMFSLLSDIKSQDAPLKGGSLPHEAWVNLSNTMAKLSRPQLDYLIYRVNRDANGIKGRKISMVTDHMNSPNAAFHLIQELKKHNSVHLIAEVMNGPTLRNLVRLGHGSMRVYQKPPALPEVTASSDHFLMHMDTYLSQLTPGQLDHLINRFDEAYKAKYPQWTGNIRSYIAVDRKVERTAFSFLDQVNVRDANQLLLDVVQQEHRWLGGIH